jgi:heme/copper-type cytochrome/quinol oxidase subunit 2
LTLIELIWTITPALILIAIAFPSFKLLYLLDEVIDPVITVKAIGNQWFWSYEYSDYVNDTGETIEFDSYMIPDTELEPGQLRLLEVDNRVILPVDTHIRFIVTARDVIHSFAVPSLGLKLDALPGRLNQTSVILNREGVFFGQCSELCGILHYAMPIVIQSVSLDKYLAFISSSQNSPPPNPTLSLRATCAKQLLTFPASRGYHTSIPTPRLSRAELKAITVTPEQHEVIVGSLLGDLCATRPEGNKRNTRLFFGQFCPRNYIYGQNKCEGNAAYLQELFTLLSSLIGQHVAAPTRRVDKITGKLSTGFQFFTRTLPCLNIYREWFYPEGFVLRCNS